MYINIFFPYFIQNNIFHIFSIDTLLSALQSSEVSSEESVRRPKSSIEIYQEILGIPQIREHPRNTRPSFSLAEQRKQLDTSSFLSNKNNLPRGFQILQQLPQLSQSENGNVFVFSFDNSQDPLLVFGG